MLAVTVSGKKCQANRQAQKNDAKASQIPSFTTFYTA